MRGKLCGDTAAGGKDGQINALEGVLRQLLDRNLVVSEGNAGSGGAGRGQGGDGGAGKVTIGKGFQHFAADGAGCAAYSNVEGLLHGGKFSCSTPA